MMRMVRGFHPAVLIAVAAYLAADGAPAWLCALVGLLAGVRLGFSLQEIIDAEHEAARLRQETIRNRDLLRKQEELAEHYREQRIARATHLAVRVGCRTHFEALVADEWWWAEMEPSERAEVIARAGLAEVIA